MWNILTSQSLTDWGHLMSGLDHLEPKENCRQTKTADFKSWTNVW